MWNWCCIGDWALIFPHGRSEKLPAEFSPIIYCRQFHNALTGISTYRHVLVLVRNLDWSLQRNITVEISMIWHEIWDYNIQMMRTCDVRYFLVPYSSVVDFTIDVNTLLLVLHNLYHISISHAFAFIVSQISPLIESFSNISVSVGIERLCLILTLQY